MAENFTMSEQAVDDAEVALEKKMKQEDQEQSHRAVVGDGGGGVLEEKRQQEQDEELSHSVVVGDGGGKKKKQEEAPQQNTNRPLRDAARAAVPYKTRVIEEILNTVGALSFAIAFGIVVGAIFENKEIDWYLSLSLALFVISTTLALLMELHNRRTTIRIISFTIITALGWGILAFALIVNHRSSSGSAFTIGDLEIFFRSCIIAIPQWILNAAFNLAN